MGIFTSNTFSGTSTDIYSSTDCEIQTEGVNINFYEAGMVAVAECESVYNKAMKEIGIGELQYMEEHGCEVIYEAVDFESIKEKIKNFFKKLIDKVKSIFHAFMTKLASWVKNDRDFAIKYEKEFFRKWGDVRDDFEFKGYKFTLGTVGSSLANIMKDILVSGPLGKGLKAAGMDIDADGKVIARAPSEWKDFTGTKNGQSVSVKAEEQIKYVNNTAKALISEFEDKNDELKENFRAGALKAICTAVSIPPSNDSESLDEKDFSAALFETFRNKESNKSEIEKKDLGGPGEIVEELKTAKKSKDAATKITKVVITDLDKAVKAIEKSSIALKVPASKEQHLIDLINNQISLFSKIASLMKDTRAYTVQANAAYLQAIVDRSRQNKAVMVKVIAGGKKMQRESYDYDYTNESASTGSFLDSVVLK